MARILQQKTTKGYTYRVTIPQVEAEEYIKKYGKNIKVIRHGKGFKLIPMKEE